jgi:hypothetical protein
MAYGVCPWRTSLAHHGEELERAEVPLARESDCRNGQYWLPRPAYQRCSTLVLHFRPICFEPSHHRGHLLAPRWLCHTGMSCGCPNQEAQLSVLSVQVPPTSVQELLDDSSLWGIGVTSAIRAFLTEIQHCATETSRALCAKPTESTRPLAMPSRTCPDSWELGKAGRLEMCAEGSWQCPPAWDANALLSRPPFLPSSLSLL